MCGIVGLHLRDPSLYPRLGTLLATMLIQMTERGPDSAGVAVYRDRDDRGTSGTDLAIYKNIGPPADLVAACDLASAQGWQGLGHTRMATESAVTPQGCHPFSVGPDQCLVHNGSFANHATIRRDLQAAGITFDSQNDSEVGARFIARRLDQGEDLDDALRALCETFDGFYTLLVTSADGFAVVRDAIACKPAVIAETSAWVAMASEYRALAGLPGIAGARIFEPEPEKVYAWRR